LGVFLAPDGNTSREQQKMRDQAIKWADCMRTGRIPREDAWLAFYSTLWKTLTYPLPALNLSKEECGKILASVLMYLLPAMGICRNFPRALVFSSIKYMGLGLKHLHATQEISRLRDIINHTYRRSTTGQLYRLSLETLFLELGLGTDLSEVPKDALQLLAANLLVKSTCEFLLQHNLELIHDIKLQPPRENDLSIMEECIKHNPSHPELLALNRCRLYLQAYWL
jgi:hypothetical protein